MPAEGRCSSRCHGSCAMRAGAWVGTAIGGVQRWLTRVGEMTVLWARRQVVTDEMAVRQVIWERKRTARSWVEGFLLLLRGAGAVVSWLKWMMVERKRAWTDRDRVVSGGVRASVRPAACR